MTYKEGKERAIQEAIDFQDWCSENNISWEGIMIASNYFEKLARKYGLVREFKENGII